MGLVKHVPNQGATVVTLDEKSMMDLYDVREVLEGKAAALAAINMSTADIEKLKSIMNLHQQHLDSNEGQYMQAEGDFDFHYQIIIGSGNELLANQLCNELYHQIRMFRVQTSRFKTRSNRAITEHKQLIDAIEQRDPEMAEMIMRRHISRAKNSITSYLHQQSEQQ